MKLALIRRQFSATGGAELYLQRLLIALREAGHELHLYTESWNSKPEDVKLHPISVKADRADRLPSFAKAVHQEIAKEDFDCIFSLERTLKQDVYRAGDGVHRVWLQRRKQFASWWRRPFVAGGAFHQNMLNLEARTFDPENTNHIIVNSEMVRGEILEHFDFPPHRIHLVRNGIDADRFHRGNRQAVRQKLGIKHDEFVMLFVGSGWERKGLKYFLRAYRGVAGENVRAVVVGKGRKPSFGTNGVIFTGPMEAIEDAYAVADLLVFLPIYEPSSNVVAEALAADLPVITTRFNGASELIRENKTGTIISDPSDTSAVVHAIERWHAKRGQNETTPDSELNLERNVEETMEILTLAAADKKR